MQAITINIHRPILRKTHVLESGQITIELGNGLYADATLFFEDLHKLEAFAVRLGSMVEELRS